MQLAESIVAHPRNADWAAELRAAGLRATSQRVAVLTYLDHNPHSDAETILRGVLETLPTVSIQAVHGIVNDLTAAQIVRRVDLADSHSAQYETRTKDNHHHVQCIECGRVEDVDCAVGHAPCLTPSDTHGMRIIETDLTFRGLCTSCERK
ncbi:Fur family transcriptional regulator [Lysinibacter cavernae]|uniref:Fur family ferric uptake transcriptional regulator n=1 Tax=Lysinibacter cavernae TaxID=1640652 RepID=A0A7X5TUX8_9MICO|nr:Fur family transcriptional regulator [Lysinibacter cavernae]NIH55119.1 Fur family ferric uptake transcriptional regulator [Lysinibacter cavernae]